MIGLHMKALLKQREITCVEVNRSRWDLAHYKTPEQLDEVFGSVGAVCHFGAFVPPSASDPNAEKIQTGNLFDANVRSCLALAEWATLRKIPVVFLSGSTVYKDPHLSSIKEGDEKVVCGFGGFYGFSKWLAENVFEHYRAQGLQLVTLRPSSVYGTFMPTNRLVANFLQTVSENKTITVVEPVVNKINLVHAADIALASLTALQQKAWGIYNIGGPSCVTIQQIAQQCVAAAGQGTIEVVDNKTGVEPFNRYNLCCDRAFAAFGYQPKVGLSQGIAAMASNSLLTLD